jgi:hypothetical protein
MKLQDLLTEVPAASSKSAFQPNLKPWMYQTKEEIEKWLKDAKIEAQISKELEVHPTRKDLILGNLFGNGPKESLVEYNGKWLLPVQFNTAPGKLEVSHLELGSMIGLPHVVLGPMVLLNVEIEDFEGCPKHISGTDSSGFYDIQIDSKKPIKSFVGCPPVQSMDVSDIIGLDGLPNTLTWLRIGKFSDITAILKKCPNLKTLGIGNIEIGKDNIQPLSVFKSKKITRFNIYPIDLSTEIPPEYKLANTIINKHLKSEERSMIACQRELIENDLDESGWAE